MSDEKVCKICGAPVRAKGLCTKHYWRWYRHGDPYIVHKVLSSSAFLLDGEAYLDLFDGEKNRTHRCRIDAEDIMYINQKTWKYGTNINHVVVNTGELLFSRYILRLAKKTYRNRAVKFINGDNLDFRKANLTLIPLFLARSYMPKHKKYRGVYFLSRSQNYVARIFLNGKSYHLGYYKKQEEAAAAYNQKALELYGDLAILNKIE